MAGIRGEVDISRRTVPCEWAWPCESLLVQYAPGVMPSNDFITHVCKPHAFERSLSEDCDSPLQTLAGNGVFDTPDDTTLAPWPLTGIRTLAENGRSVRFFCARAWYGASR
ncbi:protein of unknown function (plasmid) [Pararobbsia alpina]